MFSCWLFYRSSVCGIGPWMDALARGKKNDLRIAVFPKAKHPGNVAIWGPVRQTEELFQGKYEDIFASGNKAIRGPVRQTEGI